MEHDFNGHEVNGIHEVNGKKYHDRAFHFVNKLHDFKGIHDYDHGIFATTIFSVKLMHDCTQSLGSLTSNKYSFQTKFTVHQHLPQIS